MDFLLVDHPVFEPGKIYHTAQGYALKPLLIHKGEYAGRYVLAAHVKEDIHHEMGFDILNAFEVVELNPADVSEPEFEE